jgi:hypothetical protein
VITLRDSGVASIAAFHDLDLPSEIDETPCPCRSESGVMHRESDGRVHRVYGVNQCLHPCRVEDPATGLALDVSCSVWEALWDALGPGESSATVLRRIFDLTDQCRDAASDHPAVAYLTQQMPGVLDPVEGGRCATHDSATAASGRIRPCRRSG